MYTRRPYVDYMLCMCENLHHRQVVYVVNALPIRGPVTMPSCETSDNRKQQLSDISSITAERPLLHLPPIKAPKYAAKTVTLIESHHQQA